ncbi:NAD(P)H-binding protein [Arthrobacter sp. S39]|uniref:SDR family oxidoreductase n=1 Tax=Arthrobacter sp. S39 TaxID=2509720 RepID=UPI001036F70E|nr:NAD(P)H-binding protein [Arthrobacter sp. S39]TAP45184.1 3-beta hydroxysteroid dehydrogenase [Arthrobacter sp. S39]
MNIAVAGGTGIVGRHVVRIARERGHQVKSLSRHEGVDLVTGKGLAAALQGVETVIDVVGLNSMHTKKSTDFFMATTENLHREGKAAGVKHHVVLSIVGADKAPTGLYAGKRAQEEEVRGGDIPWTILRSTQFHEFVTQILAHASAGPLVFVPRFKTQPIAAAEVAEALVHAAEVGPQRRLPDLGGPKAERLKDMVGRYLRKNGKKRLVVEITAPEVRWKAMRSGALLPAADAAAGRQTFDEWLDSPES